MMYTVGIDVGGTFTDLFLLGPGVSQTFKVLSTPSDPSDGVLEGLAVMAASLDLPFDDFVARLGLIVHGTTVTTNAVLTREGAPTGLLTTRGVRDALEMRRGIREKQYDNRYTNVVPLVPRRHRLPVAGRLDFRGDELEPLSLDEVRAACGAFRAAGLESVAICFMHSYANADHERAAAAVVAEELPDAFLSISSDVLPTIRFYDRVSTTVLNGFVGPVLERYLSSLTQKLSGIGFAGVLLIMQSSGGVGRPEVVSQRPANTLLSGPAGGPKAAATFAQAHGDDDCILVDMGGTSFDASLVRGGAATLSSEGEIDRLRIALPMLDITTVGAGGGSIGWIDEGGLLRMGPQSAGAAPGPACYGRGGRLPTSTDADVVLGYIDPAAFAGGKMALDADAARAAIQEHIAGPLGLDVEAAAAGMCRVVNTNMAYGVREITIKRGLDPREFPMVVAGGAGPLHACMIAQELEIPRLLVPANASTLCATGMLLSDLQHDGVRSVVGPLASLDRDALRRVVAEMAAQGETELRRGGVDTVHHELSLDLRYLKQYHEVIVPIPQTLLDQDDLAGIAAIFHDAHDRLYGYNLAAEGTGLELINARVRSVGKSQRPPLAKVAVGTADASAAHRGSRRAYVPEEAVFREVPIYDGHALRAHNAITGPAIIERTDTTVFLSAGFDLEVDAYGSLSLTAKALTAKALTKKEGANV
jgi:N-methylhydantoinase A